MRDFWQLRLGHIIQRWHDTTVQQVCFARYTQSLLMRDYDAQFVHPLADLLKRPANWQVLLESDREAEADLLLRHL